MTGPRKIHLYAAAFLAATGLAHPVFAAGELPVEITVYDRLVRLGDFYPHAGDLARTALFRAPDLGTAGRVALSQIAEQARRAGFDAPVPEAGRFVTVRRPSIKYSAAQLTGLIETAIAARFFPHASDAPRDGTGTGAVIEIMPDRPLAGLHTDMPVPGGAPSGLAGASDPVVENLTLDRRSGRFSAELAYRANGRAEKRAVSGTARHMRQMLILDRDLAQNDIVRPHYFSTRWVEAGEIARSGAATLSDTERLEGLAARRTLVAGVPVRMADFAPPVWVARNEKLTLVYEYGGLMLTAQGQALMSGSPGDTIDAINLDTRRVISGVVAAPGRLRIVPRRVQIMAAGAVRP